MSWMARHKPKRDPKFHQIDKFEAAGRSIKEPLIILMAGWFFRIGLSII